MKKMLRMAFSVFALKLPNNYRTYTKNNLRFCIEFIYNLKNILLKIMLYYHLVANEHREPGNRSHH